MPDHVHLFASLPRHLRLEQYVRLLKQHLNGPLQQGLTTPERLWQPGFFDHLIRANESYEQKWEYVLRNPVRAGLVERWQDWPFQGEIEKIPAL
jgi:REP element-mobilizing transposase RayT